MTVSDPAPVATHPRVVEMPVFAGKGLTKVRIGASAPFGWWPAVILSLVSFLDRLEQSVLAGAVVDIKEYFDIGNGAVGLIGTATGIAGIVLFIPAGRIADRTKRTRALAFVLISWSILSIGSGLALSFAMLLAMRTLIGAAGQLNNPAGSSLLGDYYPGQSRTKVFGIERYVYFLANPIGVILGGIIAGVFGWQWVFLGLVIPGFLIAAGCWFLREPIRGTSDRIDAIRAGATVAEVEQSIETAADGPAESVWVDIRALLAVPTLRAIYACQAALYLGLGGLFFFTPTFYTEVFDVSEEKAGAFAGSIGLVGVSVGVVIGIRLAARYQGVRPGWRLAVAALGLTVGTIGVVILAIATVLPVAMLGFLVANIGFMMAIPNLAAAVADLAGALRRGMGFSVNQLVVGVFSALGPLIIGVLADAVGFNATFGIMAVPLAVAAVLGYRARGGYDRDAAEAVASGGIVTGSQREVVIDQQLMD